MIHLNEYNPETGKYNNDFNLEPYKGFSLDGSEFPHETCVIICCHGFFYHEIVAPTPAEAETLAHIWIDDYLRNQAAKMILLVTACRIGV